MESCHPPGDIPKLKILIPNIDGLDNNPYLTELSRGLKKYVNIDINRDAFLQAKQKYDIIHFHWPEEFANWKEPDEDQLVELEKILLEWKKRTKLILTRHNSLPHFSNGNDNYKKLYQVFYKHIDAIIHMGKYSSLEYSIQYPDISAHQLHFEIPHLVYSGYPNNVSREQARKELNIKSDRFVILVFGALRHREEKAIALKGFDGFRHSKKLLLAACWPPPQYPCKKGYNKYFRLVRKYYWHHPNKRLFYFKVPHVKVQLYFNACDFVLFPRTKVLNSGIIPLAFSFAKVVVGAKTGNITELLEATNNPVFEINVPNSINRAMEIGNELVQSRHGEKNLVYAKKYWNVDIIAEKHYNCYRTLIG